MKKYCVLSAFFIVYFCNLRAASNQADSLKLAIVNCKTDTDLIKTYIRLSSVLINSSEFDSAVTFATKARDLSLINIKKEKQKAFQYFYNKMLGNACNNIGAALYSKGAFVSAMQYHEMALSYRKQINDKAGIAASYNNIGLVNLELGNYPDAIKNQLSGLKIREEAGDKAGVASSYNSIGIIYLDQGNDSNALACYKAALKIYTELKDIRGMGKAYHNIANVHDERGDRVNALKYFFLSLKFKEQSGDRIGKARTLGNIGLLKKEEGKYDEALKYYLEALSLKEELGDTEGQCAQNINIGMLYGTLKNTVLAGTYLKTALSQAFETADMNLKKSAFEAMAYLDSVKKDYASSLKNYKLFIVYRDSLMNQENTRKIVQTQMQYEFDKKTALAKAIQEKKDAVQREELSRQRTIRNSFVGGFMLMIILALVIFRSYKQKQKANILLSLQKKEIEEKNEELNMQNEEIKTQRDEIENQKFLIEEKQKEIIDSITYARRIQRALLTNEKYFKKILNKNHNKND